MADGGLNLAVLALAALALASLFASRRIIVEAWRQGNRLQAASAQVLVAGGMLGAASFVPNQILMQVATVSILVLLLVLGEWSDTQTRRTSPTTVSSPSTLNRTSVAVILFMWFWMYAVNLLFMPDEAD